MVRIEMSDDAFQRLKGTLAVASRLTDSQRHSLDNMLTGLCKDLEQAKVIDGIGGKAWFELKIKPFALNILIGSSLLVMSLLAEAEGKEMVQ